VAVDFVRFDAKLQGDIQKFTVEVARKVLADAEARDPTWKQHKTIVDRRHNAAPETVKPGGRIEFVRNDLGEIVEWIWSELIRRSPVLTGRYQDSHVIMVDGVQVQDIRGIQPGHKVQIINTQPYAKKIEGGGDPSGATTTPQSPRAPNGVYRAVFRAAKRRYGKAVFLDYRWVKLSLGVKVWGKAGGSKYNKRVKRDMVYPAIQIRQLPPATP